MNFFNRAIKNVTRRASKTILLTLTFLLVGTLVIVGLGVSNASTQAKILTRQKMRAVATLEVDSMAWYNYVDSIQDEDERNKAYSNYPSVTLAEVNDILKDSRVKTANAIDSVFAYPDDSGLDYVHLNNSAEENSGGGQSCFTDENGNSKCVEYVEPSYLIKTNYFPSMIEIEDGDYKISEGRFYTQEEIDNSEKVCLVSKAFAEHNSLKVGDSISFLTNSAADISVMYDEDMGITSEDYTVELTIVGIYEHNQTVTPDTQGYDYLSPYQNPDNTILMPGTTYKATNVPLQQKIFDYYKTKNPDDEYYQNESNRPSIDNLSQVSLNSVTLLLKDPLEVDQFVEDYAGNLGDYKTITVDNSEFNKLAKPLDTLTMYANFIVWLVVINAVVIITLITALTLKTREYEIGVLLSLGASKFKVVAQFFVELALVALLGFTLSIGTGSLLANKVGQTVLQYQISSSGLDEEDNSNDYYFGDIYNNDYTSEVSLDDIVSNYNVSISPLIIAEIYIVGLIIVLISILIPSMMIMRFNPKKILMNQN